MTQEDTKSETNQGEAGGDKKFNFFKEVWEFLKVIIIALLIVVPIRYFIAQPFIVRGASMEPTYEDKEYLIIDELSYYFHKPERREVIVFRYPKSPSQFFIKRIIGLPGEIVEIKEGRVRVTDGDAQQSFFLEERYLPEGLKTFGDLKVILGQDEYFVLGDNRGASSDSRVWGPLERKLFIGRAFFRAWPVNRFGVVLGH